MSPRHSRAELLGLGVVVSFMGQPGRATLPQVSGIKIQERLAFVSAALGKAYDAHTVGGPHPSKIMKVDINLLVSCSLILGHPTCLYKTQAPSNG